MGREWREGRKEEGRRSVGMGKGRQGKRRQGEIRGVEGFMNSRYASGRSGRTVPTDFTSPVRV